MVDEVITKQELIDAQKDAKSLEEVVNGNDSKQVTTRLGETYPSVKKAIKALFENGGLPATPFKTKALMTASALVDGDYALVTDDAEDSGLYIRELGVWVKSAYDPRNIASSAVYEKLYEKGTTYGSEILTEKNSSLVSNSTERYDSTKLIPVKEGQMIKITTEVFGSRAAFYGYNISKKLLAKTVSPYPNQKSGVISEIYIVPNDVRYIKTTCANSNHPSAVNGLSAFSLTIAEDKNKQIYGDVIYSYDDFIKEASGGTSQSGISANYKNIIMRAFGGQNITVRGLDAYTISTIHVYDKNYTLIQSYFIKEGSEKLPNNTAYVAVSTIVEGHPEFKESNKEDFYIHLGVAESASQGKPLASVHGEYLPTPVLKAVREVTFTDGTDKTAIQYLWFDKDNNFYISSSKRGHKEFIFKYNRGDFYGLDPFAFSMGFDKYGNIICVYRIENESWSAFDEELRKNPIILMKDNNYLPTTLDFGAELRPAAWLQNCGFLATDDCVLITEYTRPSVKTANTWRVTYPVDNVANWSVVQTFPLVNDAAAVDSVKHIHNVDRDPFTGIIYTTTGDYGTGAAMYASDNGGLSFTKILENGEKYCRVLNFVFTKDWVYWATDSVGTKHWFFKAARDSNGYIDVVNIVEIQQFPLDSWATYATIYMPKIQALVFLGRADSSTATKLPIELWDLKNDVMVRIDTLVPYAVGANGRLGFRCECFEYYPKGNEIICGFDKALGAGGYENYNGLLGNTSDANKKVNNLILTIDRIGSDFTISYDTVV